MEFLANIDPVAVAMLTFAVIGFVKFAMSLVEREWKNAVKILVAGIAGAILAPYAGNVSWFIGMLIGLNASGVITAASYLGTK